MDPWVLAGYVFNALLGLWILSMREKDKKIEANAEERFNELKGRVTDLENGHDLQKDALGVVRENLPKHYTSKDELKEKLDAIHQAIRRIEENFNLAIREIKDIIKNIRT